MYLDALDPVRTSEAQLEQEKCLQFSTQGQSILIKTLLEGKQPTLTQTQVMDSKVVHDILWDPNMRQPFLTLIKQGHIHVAMYKNLKAEKTYGLQSYFLKTLQKGLKDDESFHSYSTLTFLQDLDKEVRKKFQMKVIDAMQNHHFDFHIDGVAKEDVEAMEAYLENLRNIDYALRGKFVEMGAFTKEFDQLVRQSCQLLLQSENKNEEIISLCNQMMRRQFYNTRSIYYNFLDEMKTHYSAHTIKFLKGLVDMCYNESVASSLPNQPLNISLEEDLSSLIQYFGRQEDNVKGEDLQISTYHDSNYLTWESLKDLLLEVDHLQNEKQMTRIEALQHFKNKYTLQKPAMKIAKYISLGLGPSFIPFGEGIVQVIATGVNFIAGDFINEKLKKPSQSEIFKDIQTAKTKRQLVKDAIHFTSATK